MHSLPHALQTGNTSTQHATAPVVHEHVHGAGTWMVQLGPPHAQKAVRHSKALGTFLPCHALHSPLQASMHVQHHLLFFLLRLCDAHHNTVSTSNQCLGAGSWA